MKEQKHFPKNNIRRLLFLQGIFGLFSVYGFLSLPPSESNSAILMGFSLFRLIIIIVCFSMIIFFSLMILYSFTAASKFENAWNQITVYFVNRQFLLTIIFSVLFIAAVALMFLEFLLNPSIFPRSSQYTYLYERIRPISLWVSVFCCHLFLFIRNQLWNTHPNLGNTHKAIGKKEIIMLIFIVISWIEMIILWIRYADLGKNFVNHYLSNTALLVSSLILLLIPIYLSHDSKN